MEDITLTIRIDKAYREKAAALEVDFEDYLAGIVVGHLLKRGGLNKIVAQVNKGSVSARISAHNIAGLGEAMRAMISTEDETEWIGGE